MNKRQNHAEPHGVVLLETVIQIVVLTILSVAVASGFSAALRLQHQALAALQLQEQIRFAAASITRDLTYADTVEIGNRQIVISTRRGRGLTKQMIYAVKNDRLMQNGQPLTGDEQECVVRITEFSARKKNDCTVLLRLTGRSVRTNVFFSLETGSVLFNHASRRVPLQPCETPDAVLHP